jgi:hypothetical protein
MFERIIVPSTVEGLSPVGLDESIAGFRAIVKNSLAAAPRALVTAIKKLYEMGEEGKRKWNAYRQHPGPSCLMKKNQ